MVIGYGVANGAVPSTTEIHFLLNNFNLFPAHLLQTAPKLTLVAVLIATSITLTLSVLSYRSNRHYGAWGSTYFSLLLLAGSAIADNQNIFEFTLESDAYVEEKVKKNLLALPSKTPSSSPLDQSISQPYPNVIVLLVESLRHDLLTDYSAAAPYLNDLANSEINFERAYATSSHSNLSDLAFWYSQYPLRGRNFEGYQPNDPWRGSSLFEAFKKAGYQTAYISSQNEKWGNMIHWLDTSDLDLFFHSENFHGSTWENSDDEFGLINLIKKKITSAGKIEDSETIALATKWISSHASNGPFMLGMNLQNTHYSYVMPNGAIEPYQPSALGFRAVYYNWPKEQANIVRNRYLNAVYNLDSIIRNFSNSLKEASLWENTLFVVVGDNGEGFYEHEFGNHSGPLYDEATRTLAIIKPPKNQSKLKGSIQKPVSHIDIAASILSMTGLPIPSSFQGVPIDSTETRPVFMYADAFVRQFGVVDWPWKLLVTERPYQSIELYNLNNDIEEKINMADDMSTVKKKLYAQYLQWRKTQLRYYDEELYKTKAAPRYQTIRR